LDSLTVHFTDPIARQLLAEVSPQIDVRRVEPETFSVFLRSIFVDQPVSQESPRFDEVRVVASQQTAMELLEVRLGGRDKLLAGEAEVFRVNGQAELINDIGEVIEIIPTSADSLWIKLPRLVEKDADRDLVYQRIAQEGDEAPLDKQGNALTRREYSQLTQDEQGRIDYFQIIEVDENGTPTLERVENATYENLPFASQGPVRYYRRLFAGEEVELDNDGEPLTQSSYNSLSSSRRGTVLSEGEMVELRFRSRIFLNGTTFTTQVTNSAIPNAWQQVDPGDAMERIDGVGTSVFTPIDNRILHSLEITSNPFTPNGDGINDRLQLVLSVLKIDVARQIQARFFTLAGVEVSRVNTTGVGGQQVLEWDGLDAAGTRVPPGLYLCHIWVDTDSGAQNELVRVVSLVY
jgi:hypothetical protein